MEEPTVKREKVEGCSLACRKQQIVTDKGCLPSCLIGVEAPTVLLKLRNGWTYILVMIDLHAHPLFQPASPLAPISVAVARIICPTSAVGGHVSFSFFPSWLKLFSLSSHRTCRDTRYPILLYIRYKHDSRSGDYSSLQDRR